MLRKELLAIVLIATTIISAFSQSNYKISGTVLDDMGDPVPFAIVRVKSEGKEDKVVKADIDGNYSVDQLPEGDYTVSIESFGFQPYTKDVALNKKNPHQKIKADLSGSVKTLKEAVVEAKTKEQEVREQSYNITVIDTKEMANQSSDLNEVLSTSPGVRIREEGGVGSTFKFSLNGFSGNQVRFFMDGIPMENFGQSLTLNNIPINMADRVEIYKGVVPVWLGSDALGGAVNIVTNESKKTYADVSYSYGSFNTHRSSVNAAYTDDSSGFTARVNLFQNYSDNSYKVEVDKKRENVIIPDEKETVRRFHDTYDSKAAIVDVGFVDKNYADQILIGAVLSGYDKDIQTGATMERVYGQRKQLSRTYMPTLKYKKTDLFTKGLSLNAFASYNFGWSQTIDTAARTYSWDGSYENKEDPMAGEYNRTLYKYRNNAAIVTSNLSYVASENHSFVLNYTLNSFNRTGGDEANPMNMANSEPKQISKSIIGLGYKFDWKDKLSANIFIKEYLQRGFTFFTADPYGERKRVKRSLKENFTGYGTALSYKLLPDLQLKASYEHAYRLPEGTELFGNGVNISENAQLQPEESNNINAGASYRFHINNKHEFALEASYLRRETYNYIRETVGNPNSSFTNTAEVLTNGVEGNIQYGFKNKFTVSTNATYQFIVDNKPFEEDGDENAHYLVQVPNEPYLFANLNASYHLRDLVSEKDHLTFTYYLNYVEAYFLKWASDGSPDSKLDIPRQISHDLIVGYSLRDGKYNISFECRNIFDAKLYDNFKLQKPGRAFYVKLRYFIRKS